MTSPNFLRYAAWVAILSAVASVLETIMGILWLMSAFALFYGGLTDIFSVSCVALMLPLTLALHLLLRSYAPVLSLVATTIGIAGILVYGSLQSLLVIGVLRYEQVSIPNIVASAAVGIWLLLANYIALRNKFFPRGLAWAGMISGLGFVVLVLGFLIYPIWAIWLGRWLLAKAQHERQMGQSG